MKTALQTEDVVVIERIVEGEPELFEVLIRRHNALLYKTGRSYQFDHETTQDLMQDTFIDAYCNLGKFEHRSTFRTWLLRIMLNNCYRKKQKNGFSKELPQIIQEKSIPMFSTQKNTDTNREVLNRELGSFLEAAIQSIPLQYRMVFSLREINGLNVDETAEVMNISATNVKVRLNRAKSMLRKELKNAYSPAELFDFNLVFCDAMVNRVMKKIMAGH